MFLSASLKSKRPWFSFVPGFSVSADSTTSTDMMFCKTGHTKILNFLGLPFTKKIQKFLLKVKWNSNFPKNPFRDCRLLPEVALRMTEISSPFGKSSSFSSAEKIVRNQIANGKRHLICLVCCFWKYPQHYPMAIPTHSF